MKKCTKCSQYKPLEDFHIDHIIPVSVFPSDADTKTVNAISNLRPLWATNREIDGVVLQGNLNKGVSH